MKSFYAVAALTIALFIPSIAPASILYSSMPDNDLTAPDLVFDSGSGFFHLDSYAVLSRIAMALWVNPGDPPTEIDWAIEDYRTNTVIDFFVGATISSLMAPMSSAMASIRSITHRSALRGTRCRPAITGCI